jgi:hypothetical protein
MSFKIVGNVLPKFFLDELEKSIAANVAIAINMPMILFNIFRYFYVVPQHSPAVGIPL